jgi:hypothetical protein
MPAVQGWLSAVGRLRVGYYAVLLLYLCSWIVFARTYRPETRLLPIVVVLALLVGVGIRIVTHLLDKARPNRSPASIDPNDEAGMSVDTRRAVVGFGWLAGLVVIVLLLGLLPGIGVFVTLFTGRYEGYRRGLLVGIGTVLFVAILFVGLLELPTFEPYAVRLLELGGEQLGG